MRRNGRVLIEGWDQSEALVVAWGRCIAKFRPRGQGELEPNSDCSVRTSGTEDPGQDCGEELADFPSQFTIHLSSDRQFVLRGEGQSLTSFGRDPEFKNP
jgi:hypothetical protein